MQESLGVERYQIVRLVGRGGMGELYEVWDTRLERRVAVKRLHPHLSLRPDSESLVLSEARAAAKIEHPNVVRVYGVEQAGDALLIEMQFIDGRPLSSLFFSGPLSPTLAVDLLKQSLEGLAACHARGVIHCDLKPANMLVNAAGAVFLTDFGIARALRDPLELSGRENESIPHWGTPRYSPPESWRGEAPTPQWDLYALGVVLYESLTGASPFSGQTLADIRTEVFSGPEHTLTELRPDLSPAFTSLIDSLMAIEANARPASAKAALARLRDTPEYLQRNDETALSLRPRNATPTPPYTLRLRAQKKRWLGAMILAMMLLLAVTVASIAYQRGRAESAEPPTPQKFTTAEQVAELPPAAPPVILPPAPRLADLLIEPHELSLANGTVYFAWDDGFHGEELWGIPPGEKPRMVADMNPGPSASHPHTMFEFAGKNVVFAATQDGHGEELWISMGFDKSAGAFFKPNMIKDVIEGEMGSAPYPLATKGKMLVFFATTLQYGRELWCTNGNKNQTAIVRDVNVGPEDATFNRDNFWSDDTGAYWRARATEAGGCGLMRYEFATNQVNLVGRCNAAMNNLAVINGKAIFGNDDNSGTAQELWSYDPKSAKMALLVDLAPGPEVSKPEQFYTWPEKNIVLFNANCKDTGSEIWKTDGTAEGTVRLASIQSKPKSPDPGNFVSMGDYATFRASDVEHGYELWVTDGTPEGTHILKDVNPGEASFKPYNETRIGNRVVFTGDDGEHGEEMWVVERKGDDWDVHMVKDLMPGPLGSYPNHMKVINDREAVFTATEVILCLWIFHLEIKGDEISLTSYPMPEPVTNP